MRLGTNRCAQHSSWADVLTQGDTAFSVCSPLPAPRRLWVRQGPGRPSGEKDRDMAATGHSPPGGRPPFRMQRRGAQAGFTLKLGAEQVPVQAAP